MENTETKVCSKCGLEKPLSDFYFNKNRKKYENTCKSCRRCEEKTKKELFRNSINNDDTRVCISCNKSLPLKKYKTLGSKKCLLCSCNKNNLRTRQYEWKLNNPEKILLSQARERATKDGLAFDLTIDDIFIPDVCPVFGVTLGRGNKTASPNSPSLDKIIPEKGYVKGNVRVISYRANTIKSNGTADEHLKIAKYIEKNLAIDNDSRNI